MMKSKKFPVVTALIMLVTAIAITVCGILFEQAVWRMLPLYVSLVIALLQSRVSRLAPLLGGANALLYAAVYFSYKLYASAAYALLLSCPLQIVTFVRWQKRPSGGSTVLRKMSARARVLTAIGFAAVWSLLALVTKNSGSSYYLLDNTVTLLGILATLLMMLSYAEYTYVMVVSGICNLSLYVAMLGTNPEQLTYLVYTAYSLMCSILATVTANRAFKEKNQS